HGDGGFGLEPQSLVWPAGAQSGARAGVGQDGVSTLPARHRVGALSDCAHGSAGDLPGPGLQPVAEGFLCDVGTRARNGACAWKCVAPKAFLKNAVRGRSVVRSGEKQVARSLPATRKGLSRQRGRLAMAFPKGRGNFRPQIRRESAWGLWRFLTRLF